VAVQASQLIARVATEGVDTSKQQLQGMGQTVKETSSGFKSMLGNALSFAAGQAVFNMVGNAVGYLKNQVADSIGLAMQHQDILEQTEKVLKSTGGAAGMTQQSLENLASSLEKSTYFSKDQTEAGENMLLTFTEIGKDVFPLATKTMLDMSKAMGQDVKSTAIMMGKALNDPATGLTALTRVGVTFSTQQQDMIKHMVAVGDTAGAQKIMLAELQREFGGSADATQTLGGKWAILTNRMNDFKERIATGLFPVFGALLDHLVSPAFDEGEKLFHGIGDAAAYVGNVLRTVNLSSFNEAWRNTQVLMQDIEGRISRGISPALKLLKTDADPVAQVIGNLAQGGLNVLSNILWSVEGGLMAVDKALATGKGPFGEFGDQAKTIASLLGGQFVDGFKFAGQQASQISKWFQGSGIIKDVGQEFHNLASVALDLSEIFVKARGVVVDIAEHAFAKFAPYIEKILPPLVKFGTAIDTGIAGALKYVKPYIEQALAAFEKFADGVIDRVTPIIDRILPYILLGVQEVAIGWNEIWPSLSAVLKGAWDIITGVIQIAWSLISGIINVGLDVLSGNWGQAWDDIKAMFSGVWDGIKNIASGALNILKTIFSPIGQWFSDRFHEAWSGITGVFGNIGHWFSDRWNEIVNFTKTVIARMVDGFMVPFKAIGALFVWLYDHNKYFKMLIDTITGIVSTGVAWLQNAWKVSIDWIIGEWSNIVKFASDIWGKVSGAIHDGFFAAVGFVASVWGSISSFFSNAWNDYIVRPLTALWTNVSGFFSGVWNNYIAKPVEDLWNSLSTTVGGWADKAVDWGKNLIKSFVNGIVSMANNVAGAVGGIAQKVLEFLGFHSPTKEGPGQEADQWAPNFIKMYTEGLRAGIPQIEGVVSQLVKPVSVSLNPSMGSPSYMPPGTRVTPASQIGAMQGSASSGGATTPIYLQVDGNTFARLFLPAFVSHVRNQVGIRF
jgi:phage-related protein